MNNAKVEPKIVQGILRYAKIRTALDLYTQEDIDETLAAQGEYLSQIPKKERLLARGQDFF